MEAPGPIFARFGVRDREKKKKKKAHARKAAISFACNVACNGAAIIGRTMTSSKEDPPPHHSEKGSLNKSRFAGEAAGGIMES